MIVSLHSQTNKQTNNWYHQITTDKQEKACLYYIQQPATSNTLPAIHQYPLSMRSLFQEDAEEDEHQACVILTV